MNVLNFTLCYPLGECHPDAWEEMPPADIELYTADDQTSSNYELYEFGTSATVPVIGEIHRFVESGGYWQVVAVETYTADTTSDIKGFYNLICTKDGMPPSRGTREGYAVLGMMMSDQSFVERMPGFTDWWYGSELSIPKPSSIREVLTFTPTARESSYDTVVICRHAKVLQIA